MIIKLIEILERLMILYQYMIFMREKEIIMEFCLENVNQFSI